jgi:hypothetical protein
MNMNAVTPREDGSYEVLGNVVRMPVHVRAARQAAATFLVPHAAAQHVVRDTGLQVTRKGRHALVSLAIVDYIDNDLGSYLELALGFMVDDPAGTPAKPKGAVSTYIHRLPVSEEFTCAAGRGIWGFPKWIANMEADFDPSGASCRLLTESGETIVSVRIKRGAIPVPRKEMDMVAYSAADGVLRRTPWTSGGTGRQYIRPGGASVELGYGHPIADELRALGFPRRALMSIVDDNMTAVFGPASVVE